MSALVAGEGAGDARCRGNAEDDAGPVSYTHLDVYKRQSLHRLVKEGTISKEVALQHAIHQEALKKRFETEGM